MSGGKAEQIAVECQPTDAGWSCHVSVGPTGNSLAYEVTVSRTELERFAPTHTDPDALVGRSFHFLLDREPRESILRRFAISEIERYFPDFPSVVAQE